MKKTFFLLFLISLSNSALAQVSADKTEEIIAEQNDYITQYFDEIDTAQKAQSDAGMLLEQQPNILDLRDSQKRLIKEGEQKRLQYKKDLQRKEIMPQVTAEEILVSDNENQSTSEDEILEMTDKYSSAPFGLFWGISKTQTEEIGFKLQPAERKDYQQVFLITNPKQNIKTFDIVTAIFGEQDKLWCIFAQSSPQNDTPQASNVLELYHKYYDALEQKYGNAHQYFTPNSYTEEIITGTEENTQKETITKTSAIGNDNFLQELKDGNAVLYATFENDDIGITLGISVDDNNQSYISLDYKNLKIMHENEQSKLNNLINDI